VSDVVGYLGYGSVHPLGWRCGSLYVSDAYSGRSFDSVADRTSGTCLWLWLGVLDALQGVGLGMILLQTLSRLHVCATLAGAQLLGSCVVMLARGTAPDKVGPGNVFPNPAIWNPSTGENNPFIHWEFWFALVCQIVIVIGYFFFFRKEQLVSDCVVCTKGLLLTSCRVSHSRTLWRIGRKMRSVERERARAGQSSERKQRQQRVRRVTKSRTMLRITNTSRIPPYTDLYVHLSFLLDSWQCKISKETRS
jgi:hypothetical protein